MHKKSSLVKRRHVNHQYAYENTLRVMLIRTTMRQHLTTAGMAINEKTSHTPVAHAHNPSYLGVGD
jgi:hypothetical protein